MARSQTARFGLWRWSDDTDTQDRSDFDHGNGQIEALAAQAAHGLRAARPAVGVGQRVYFATDTGELFYDDGTTWHLVRPNATPRGVVDQGVLVADSASKTALDEVELEAMALATVPGRLYKVTVQALLRGTIAGDLGRLRIRQAVTDIATSGGVELTRTAIGYSANCFGFFEGDGNDQAWTAQIERVSGSGTVRITASATDRATITIEDIGLVPA